MHKNLPTVEGVKTRFLCSITADEGTNTTLAGYVKVGGESLPMTPAGENELVAPATPAGDYLYELRVGGAVALWGHLCARPSAFPPAHALTDVEVSAAMSGETAMAVDVALHEGPRGPQGEKGEQGDKGDKGEQGAPGSDGVGGGKLEKHIYDGGGMDPGCVYTLTVGPDTYDLSSLSIGRSASDSDAVLTTEILIEVDGSGGEVIWPEDLEWLEGAAPMLEWMHAYQIVIRDDGAGRRFASVAYSYEL